MNDPRKTGPAQPDEVERPEQGKPGSLDEGAAQRPGSVVDADDQDQSEADPSAARQKDRARDDPKTPGTGDAGPDEDTYD